MLRRLSGALVALALLSLPVLAAQNFDPTVTVTRPNDTTAYTAGDVWGGVISLTNAGPFRKLPTTIAMLHRCRVS